jgi:glucosamine--fructose-6-phosphate aminotransferase (isomerizing)
MLLGIQALGACMAGRKEFSAALRRLPMLAQRALDSMQPAIQRLVEAHSFADYVFLAQGPLFGIASEGHLKVKEMSCSFAQVYHSLEFRHGPKALVDPDMLLTFLMSETGYDAEREVLEEMKALGGTTLVIANEADARVRDAADFLIELKLDLPEYARIVVYAMAAQLLGLYTGIKKGLDPDHPRNLSRVVILGQ